MPTGMSLKYLTIFKEKLFELRNWGGFSIIKGGTKCNEQIYMLIKMALTNSLHENVLDSFYRGIT